MKCCNCNNENKNSSKFCFNCGAKFEDNDGNRLEYIEKKDEFPTYNAKDNEQDVGEDNKIENDEKQLIKKKASLNLYVITTMVAFLILALTGAVAFNLTSNKKVMIFANKVNQQKSKGNSNEALKTINMINEEYDIIPGQVEIVKFYTYPQNSNIDGLKWKSSNGNIKVNQGGCISSTKPNAEGVITVSNADGSVNAKCKVKVLTKEEAFFTTMNYINSKGIQQQKQVNLLGDKFIPRKRSNGTKESWKDDIFVTINKEIPSYQLTQKQFINAETKNQMDCDVYVDPKSGDIRKIVTIEHVNDILEITDYYYMDGSVSFIFERNEKYYRPISAQQDFAGSRYFYCENSLLKWREIKKSSSDMFEKTDYNYNKGNFGWKTYEYKNIEGNNVDNEKSKYIKASEDSKLQKQREEEFINREKNMLNAAYNIYNKVAESPNITNITGYVVNDQGQPMDGVSVKVFSEEYKLLVGEVKTNSNGLYNINVPMNDLAYTIHIDKPEYIGTTIYDVGSNLNTLSLFQQNVYMYPINTGSCNITLNLVNAVNGSMLNGNDLINTHVAIRKGINNKNGTVEQEFQVTGTVLNVILEPGNYTAEVISPGCEKSYFTISTRESNMQMNSNVVPKITNDEVRIVLSWGSQPTDLDSHLFLPNNNEEHISYYSHQVGNTTLDLDDTDGYGPETITINQVEKGTYKYYVSDFTNCCSSNYSAMDMSKSFGRVDVYTKNGLVSTFTVPNNREGVIWHVFNISNGKIIPVQRYFNNIEDHKWWSSSK